MSAFARTGRAFFLAVICCSAALVDLHSGRSASAPDASGGSPGTQPVTYSMPVRGVLGDEPLAYNPVARPDLTAMTFADISAKWSELQSRIHSDEVAVATCRSEEAACSQAARHFVSIVELGQHRKGRVRFGWINRTVNMAIRPTSDWTQYGFADFWASPLQTLTSGAGDCEDYAIVKYVALRELGIPSDDLRLVIVQDEKRGVGHAVVAVRYEQRWLILDNRTMAIFDADEVHDYRPLFALDQQGTRAIATAAVEQATNR